MSRVYFASQGEVTTAWAHVGSSLTMSRLVSALDQWHEAHRAQFMRDGYTNLLPTFDTQEEKHAHIGATYVRLDVGSSGAWMLEISTGIVYGIKGYGKVDKKKVAGNITDQCFDGAVLFRDRFRRGRFDNRSFHTAECPTTQAHVVDSGAYNITLEEGTAQRRQS